MNKYNPVSTYRLQFNSGFTLKQALKTTAYLRKLGVKTIYASPVLEASNGSTHGYDVTNPARLNKEIGTEEQFKLLVRELKKEGIGWLQDIVPNHMAYSTENPWIFDLLEKGENSAYYSFFDIDKNHPLFGKSGKIILPFFGKPIHQVINDGELKVIYDNGRLYLKYFDNQYPLSVKVYSHILGSYRKTNIPGCISNFIDTESAPENWENVISKLTREYKKRDDVVEIINQSIDKINNDNNELKHIVNLLSYIPAYWKETEELINYRRFFTINGLICLHINKAKVFELYHKKTIEWIKDNLIQGLRIDHIDGISDPADYITKLRKKVGKNISVYIEKILEQDETYPPEWSIEGTTGYDFLADVNKLLANKKYGSLFRAYYYSWRQNRSNYQNLVFDKKKFILHERMLGELNNLTRECSQIKCIDRKNENIDTVKEALSLFLVHFPQYRLYNAPAIFTADDIKLLKKTLNDAKNNSKDKAAIKLLEVLVKSFLNIQKAEEKEKEQLTKFFFKLMQYTGPLMAKGVEDTLCYSYNYFIAHNEVGDSPKNLGSSIDAFHRKMTQRQSNTPLTLNAISTHDTKRGEDVRARLNVLLDIPVNWMKASTHWRKLNKKLKSIENGKTIPSLNDEYLIYQSLVGHVPMDANPDENFKERFKSFMIKALRESKENSSWSEPNISYEEKTIRFIDDILSPQHSFLKHFLEFMKGIIPHGIKNSITQLIIKNMAPGVPDTFQGSEEWNLSFVDPDNRQAVDFSRLSKQLNELIEQYSVDAEKFSIKLWEDRQKSTLKQFFTWLTLNQRNDNPNLFLHGRYIPVKVKGTNSKHIISFLRQYKNDWLLVVAPLNTAELPKTNEWENTKLLMPEFSPYQWKNLVDGNGITNNGEINIPQLFKYMPFAILKNEPMTPERRAGVLIHVSSLPGSYGIGDFGSVSRSFIDFLHRTGQQYWQLLPLNITSSYNFYSPYSSYSAFAGNPLFIDPEWLVDHGLVNASSLNDFSWEADNKVDFQFAETAKNFFLNEAFITFKELKGHALSSKFEEFKKEQRYWLNDFALFMVIKIKYNDKAWYEWPIAYRDRKAEVLKTFQKIEADAIEKVKFIQFIFGEQWKSLKKYADEKNVQIIGDVPIYVSHDSADVWAHSKQFRLSATKEMQVVAGVPPDYFNENGQLWGMPIYNWPVMQREKYVWWMNRLRRNLEWFDLVRLDHFRGFSAYWEVPATDSTAINGKWVKGPGNTFFDTLKNEFPEMPFIAEDLGQIDQPVYDLRDAYSLPGMKVVQFGFGDHMAFTQHAPCNHSYNSIVYTGTHDNNTMRGWYNTEVDKQTLQRFKKFTGVKLRKKKCHLQMIKIAYASTSKLAIVPFQDWLGLDENARMNFPSTTENNWLWMLNKNAFNKKLEKQMSRMTKTFGRF